MSNVQRQKPKRSCTKSYNNYASFKPYLQEDFNQRCGYCDDPDVHYGYSIIYQIDHFKPKSKFPELRTDYSNLVYSCPYCNRAKSNTWKKIDGFIDPCSREYDNHLERNATGRIIHITPRGKYIIEQLQLFLKRHEVIWRLSTLESQKQKLDKIESDDSTELETLRQFKEIQGKIDVYTRHNLISE